MEIRFKAGQMTVNSHDTTLIKAAISIQDQLRNRYPCGEMGKEIGVEVIGGADAAYAGDTGIGVIAVLSFPELEPIGHATAVRKVQFPYISGLFAFRELPLYLAAYEKLGVFPDLLLINGHGYAHPRRFGLACHAGASLGVPTIGIAARPVIGKATMPGNREGACSPLMAGRELVGMVVRTTVKRRPVFVSAGFRTDLRYAVEMTIASSAGERIPLPIQAADRLARAYRKRYVPLEK
jgi:deoxyribonuclease V